MTMFTDPFDGAIYIRPADENEPPVCVTAEVYGVIVAAEALLKRIDDITTDDFSKGGERTERETLRLALAAIK